ncbi:hypothetical protein EG68_03493 [Paragonimus skrjabini miyazakii]|uniref:UPF0506 domain-containing protein n=1 Tax=Paragonimus skrjabini miyazakii TaxID=59628 RepID=A0A8S9Z7S9_9TREM|nr:hypothetical protein EG68_03493 [Paragonimus skrjabini miyazakii]
MNNSSRIVSSVSIIMHFTIYLALLFLPLAFGGRFDCRQLGESCWKTIFDACCDTAVCDLSTRTCVQCYEDGHGCMTSKECCSRSCFFFMCRPN